MHRLVGTAYDHLGGGYTADYKGCMDFGGPDAMRHVRLMKPFKDNRIQIHPDIDCKGETMASIMKKSKVPEVATSWSHHKTASMIIGRT